MKRWLVTRHPGAGQWFARHDYTFDHHIPHADVSRMAPGDAVYGTLPVPLVAELCERGMEYWHLSIPMKAADRGRELSADDLDSLGATLERFWCVRHPKQ